jgi:DNA helicase-2/ATP-dependent DNA helicase PcrA
MLKIDTTTRSLPLLEGLNPEQRMAVENVDGPMLVLAGAGTGKTKVLTTRIAHILMSGRAYPSQILAVTFTNKAAREMRERVEKMVGPSSAGLWLGTFHSIGIKILRKHGELIGLKPNFNVLDADDQIRLIKTLMQELNIDDKRFAPKMISAVIQRHKDKAEKPEQADDPLIRGIYEAYQRRMLTLNVVDFGDLLLHCITLFTSHPEVLHDYQRRFHYMLVDEYQDTNVAQYIWLRLLAQGHRNICCVGDDDQSIYGWRGAEIGNILKFEVDFPGAKVVRLERNYRSTSPILKTASHLIANNEGRLGKTLWTDAEGGPKVKVLSVWDEKHEARAVADEIEAISGLKKHPLNEIAVLVRAGHLTRAFEETFMQMGISYRVIGGLRFYERMEIRDAIAYLRLVQSSSDDLALERIINTPKRGIGDSTITNIRNIAIEQNTSLFAAVEQMLLSGGFKGKMATTLKAFIEQRNRWAKLFETLTLRDATEKVLDESGYLGMWKAEKTPEAQGRVENLKELLTALDEFDSLDQFLEHISLVMDADQTDDSQKANIMTLHAAKGLEFETVFLPGWEEGIFPSQRTLEEKGKEGLEEERRLAYVGITRSKRHLTISFAANRRVFNQWQTSLPSRFIDELPEEQVEVVNISGMHNTVRTGMEENRNFSRFNQFSNAIPKAPPKETDGYSQGNRVFHNKFGYGTILEVQGAHLKIAFDKAGMKLLVESFVSPVKK